MSTAPERDARNQAIPPETLVRLRPYMINLTRGRLSDTGTADTTEQDLDRIFAEHLPKFVADHGGANVPVVVWAHGGLVDEASGIRIADRQARWWTDNGVYPLHFVWESGLGDAMNQLFASWIGARGVAEAAADSVVEWTAHHLGGTKVWGAMKSSAELAAAPGGGARLVAEKLGRFVAARPGAIRLHAVGHSAGSIFHRHFLPAAIENGVTFRSLALLAPAIRTDEFRNGLAPLVGAGLDELTMITMDRYHERADVCAAGSFTFYHHSLLMLIRAALEDTENTPILGLEESVQADPVLWGLFGPGGPAHIRLITSPTPATEQPALSTSTSHGGFDDDPPTMTTVARHVLGDEPTVAFGVAGTDRAPDVVATPSGASTVGPIAAAPAPDTAAHEPRRALCVGVNAYPRDSDKLRGCVADARAWEAAFRALGFSVTPLHDGQATRQAIVNELTTLIGKSRNGDVIAFQYSGHGTQIADNNGDEPEDQALCPVDFRNGALLIDDDIAELIAALPDGVTMTCFLDSCHSESATREIVDPDGPPARPGTPRYVKPDATLLEAHRDFRRRTGRPTSAGSRGAEVMREVTFSACAKVESAFETDGRGDYSRAAVPLLAVGGLTNQEFMDRVVEAMGPRLRQHPTIDPDGATARVLLAPMSGDAAVASGPDGWTADDHRADRTDAVATLLTALGEVIRTR